MGSRCRWISFIPSERTSGNGGWTCADGDCGGIEGGEGGFEIVAKYPRLRRLPIVLSEADPEGARRVR